MHLKSVNRQAVWRVAWRVLAAAASALIAASAFPPFEQSEAAWAALAPLLILARFTRPLPAFRWGLASGFLFWLVSLCWLLQIGRTGTMWPVAGLAWASLAAYCALYTAMFTAVVSALFARARERDVTHEEETTGQRWRDRLRNLLLVVLVPLAWVGFEYLRCVLFTGFPWNPLGVSQYRNVGVIQLAEWGGVYAVSAVIVCLNTVVCLFGLRIFDTFRRRNSALFQFELMAGLLGVLGLMLLADGRLAREAARPSPGTLVRVAAIQPNIEQKKKWVPGAETEIFTRLDEQTELALASKRNLDLVVWPETALPAAINADAEALAFAKGMARGNAPLLAGSMEVGGMDSGPRRADTTEYFNSSFLLSRDGDVLQVYRKRHLVLFGECLPFERQIPLLSRLAPLGFSCSPGATSTVFRLPLEADGERAASADFAVLICFEDTVPRLARESVRNGARFLVVQTNDAWFDPSPASWQHMSHCVFRCVENRVPAVRVANTGVSCFIDRLGRIENRRFLEEMSWDRRVTGCKISRVAVEGPEMPLTFYTRFGDAPFALPCGILSLVGFVLVARAERRKNADNMRGIV